MAILLNNEEKQIESELGGSVGVFRMIILDNFTCEESSLLPRFIVVLEAKHISILFYIVLSVYQTYID